MRTKVPIAIILALLITFVGQLIAEPPAQELASREQMIDLGGGKTLRLVLIPAGEFMMGALDGQPDEQPVSRVAISRPFWMGAFEVSNEQFRQFHPAFDAQYYGKRHARADDQGLPLNEPLQPAIGISWRDAMTFCHWLSQRTGRRFTLPTEAQWEWACRAGTTAPLSTGDLPTDFSRWANLADKSFAIGSHDSDRFISGGVEHLWLDGADLSDQRFNDGYIVTAPIGSFPPNAWGLFDMHGNAAEWTLSEYRPYPYLDDDGRNDVNSAGRRVVRGGSFYDPPRRSRSAARLDYPAWQRVFNVGFRVVCDFEPTPTTARSN